jgi:hypothetical protein
MAYFAPRLPNLFKPLSLQDRGARVISYCNSNFASGSLIFDGKHTVVGQVSAVFVEDLCREVLVGLVANYEMDVCGAEWVTVHHLQQVSCGTVVGDLERRQKPCDHEQRRC